MFGVLLDVSGSMRSAYSLYVDKTRDTSVQRTHAVVTTVANIARREAMHHGRKDTIFACAFGLRNMYADICDLIHLFETMKASPWASAPGASPRASAPRTSPRASPQASPWASALSRSRQPSYDPLIELAKRHRAPRATEPLIRRHLSEASAWILYQELLRDESLIPILLWKLPSSLELSVANYIPGPLKSILVTKSEAYTYAMEIISRGEEEISRIYEEEISRRREEDICIPWELEEYIFQRYKHEVFLTSRRYKEDVFDESNPESNKNFGELPKPRPVQYVSELLDELLQTKPAHYGASPRTAGSDVDESVYDAVQELIDTIKPYIYGYTPMCKAMNQALSIFRETAGADKDKPKVLFILSDGKSTDGNPCPIAQELKALGVSIVTCYLTDTDIQNPKRLLDAEDPTWEDGRLALFKMSASMHNTHTPVSYLVDAGWELPLSGESRLFVQANSLDVVNELCSIVISQMTKGCDALVDILAKVSLATYINQANDDFKSVEQDGDTCYANAVAAVLYLAMQRIVEREGGMPVFDDIRQQIIGEYGDNAITRVVVEKVCSKYRLHFRTVDETGARKAINERRPVITVFQWYKQEHKKFCRFFRDNKKGILKRADLHTSEMIL